MTTPTIELTLFTQGDFHDQDKSVLDAFFEVHAVPDMTLRFWPHPGLGHGYLEDADVELRDEMASFGLQRFPSWGLALSDGQRVGSEGVRTPSMLTAWLRENAIFANAPSPPPPTKERHLERT